MEHFVVCYGRYREFGVPHIGTNMAEIAFHMLLTTSIVSTRERKKTSAIWPKHGTLQKWPTFRVKLRMG
jgi:hypothetical protein